MNNKTYLIKEDRRSITLKLIKDEVRNTSLVGTIGSNYLSLKYTLIGTISRELKE